VVLIAERGGALKNPEKRDRLRSVIERGRGCIALDLTHCQYSRLKANCR
jgi:hypothetical protein